MNSVTQKKIVDTLKKRARGRIEWISTAESEMTVERYNGYVDGIIEALLLIEGDFDNTDVDNLKYEVGKAAYEWGRKHREAQHEG